MVARITYHPGVAPGLGRGARRCYDGRLKQAGVDERGRCEMKDERRDQMQLPYF